LTTSIRTARAGDAEKIVELYQEFAQYLATLDMEEVTEGKLTPDSNYRDNLLIIGY